MERDDDGRPLTQAVNCPNCYTRSTALADEPKRCLACGWEEPVERDADDGEDGDGETSAIHA